MYGVGSMDNKSICPDIAINVTVNTHLIVNKYMRFHMFQHVIFFQLAG